MKIKKNALHEALKYASPTALRLYGMRMEGRCRDGRGAGVCRGTGVRVRSCAAGVVWETA